MKTSLNPFLQEVAQCLFEAFALECQDQHVEPIFSVEDIYDMLEVPPEFSLGQSCLACFPFAKIFRKAPAQIALSFAKRIQTRNKHFISQVNCVQGYLNFFAQFSKMGQSFFQSLHEGSFFEHPFLEDHEKDKIVVEYSQPNTHKALHVGHLRGLIVGDALCRLLEAVGHTVVRATYPGDVGTHVAKIIWYLSVFAPQALPTTQKTRWLGRMYAQADEAFLRVQASPQASAVRQCVSQILKELNEGSGSFYELWKETRQWSLDELQNVYAWLGTPFDVWYFESECEAPSQKLVHEKYQQGFFVKDKGAIGIDLSPWKLGFAMFLKSDGNGLYLTKDLDLIVKKFSDPQVTKSIYIVDSRQKLHFQQLFKTAELMGYPQAKKSLHLSYETVNTQEGKPFSSRQLNGLQLEDLKNKMEERVISHYLERYQGQWSPKEILGTAQDIAKGALKYGMLCVDHNTQIRFSLEEWLRLDGDTGPYLQYVHARCCRILEKQGKPSQKTEFQVQEHSEEQLLCALVHFRVVVKHSAKQYRPCVLARYLHDLAKTFNQFYEQCPIQILPAGVMKESRLALVWGTQKIIQRGLCLLGIPAPEKM